MQHRQEITETEDVFAGLAEGAEVIDSLARQATGGGRQRRLQPAAEHCEFEQLEPRILLSGSDPTPDVDHGAECAEPREAGIEVELKASEDLFDIGLEGERFFHEPDEELYGNGEDLPKDGEDADADEPADGAPAEDGEKSAGQRPGNAPVPAEQPLPRPSFDCIDGGVSKDATAPLELTDQLIETLRSGRGPPSQTVFAYAVPSNAGPQDLTLRLAEGRGAGVLVLEDGDGNSLLQRENKDYTPKE